MLKPNDFLSKKFKFSLFGISKKDVLEFNKEASNDFEKMIIEISEQRAKNKLLEDELTKFKELENSLKGALILANDSKDQIVTNAREKAQNILDQANNQANEITSQVNSEYIKIKLDYENLINQYKIFLNKYKMDLETELEKTNKKLTTLD
jgi:cell division initiation protein